MKKIIIVGGSKGIGEATSKLLLENHHIICISRTEPAYQHDNLEFHSCDILKDELPEISGPIDGLIYCPGSINLKPFKRLSLDEFRDDLEINLLGAVKTIQAYLDNLKESSEPSVVLFSTVAVKMGMPFHASIAAAKAGVEGLVRSLAAEFAPNLRINAIAPTVTNTDLASKLLRNDKMIENIKERHPLKNFLDPSEVAHMARYLLSSHSKSVSGQIFEMDFGIVSLKV